MQVGVEGRPVHDGVTGSAVPGRLSTATVTEAGDVTDEDLVRAEGVRWDIDLHQGREEAATMRATRLP